MALGTTTITPRMSAYQKPARRTITRGYTAMGTLCPANSTKTVFVITIMVTTIATINTNAVIIKIMRVICIECQEFSAKRTPFTVTHRRAFAFFVIITIVAIMEALKTTILTI